MAVELKDLSYYKQTVCRVPSHLGPDRGRAIMVKLQRGGVTLRPKRRQKGTVFVSWEEIYAMAVEAEAKR